MHISLHWRNHSLTVITCIHCLMFNITLGRTCKLPEVTIEELCPKNATSNQCSGILFYPILSSKYLKNFHLFISTF